MHCNQSKMIAVKWKEMEGSDAGLLMGGYYHVIVGRD
jgi:hypothetical protein